MLATVGVYGVAGYVAALRTREIGVRIALGATSGAARRMIVAQSSRPIVLGIVTGLALALSAGRLVQTFLVGVGPTDPLTFAAAAILLAIVAFAASYVPAMRAGRLAPVEALRED